MKSKSPPCGKCGKPLYIAMIQGRLTWAHKEGETCDD